MNLLDKFESNVVLRIKERLIPGRLVYSPEKGIRTKVFYNGTLAQAFLESEIIGNVHGSIDNPVGDIILFNSKLSSCCYRSGGIVDYEISSEYAVIGIKTNENDIVQIQELFLKIDSLEEWIGNYLIEIDNNDNLSEFIYRIKMEKELLKYSFADYEVSIKQGSTIPLGYHENNEYLIRQITTINVRSKKVFRIQDIVNVTLLLENFFSAFTQNRVGVSEVSYYVGENEKRNFRQLNYLLLPTNSKNTGKYRSRPILSYDEFSKNASSFFEKWILALNKNKYLSTFMSEYFEIKMLNQRVFALITLIESLHKQFYQSFRLAKDEYEEYVEKILSFLPDEYIAVVKKALCDKNNLVLRERLNEMSIYSDYKDRFCELVPIMIEFRNGIAHSTSNTSIDESVQKEIENILMNVFSNILIRKVLEFK